MLAVAVYLFNSEQIVLGRSWRYSHTRIFSWGEALLIGIIALIGAWRWPKVSKEQNQGDRNDDPLD